MALPDSKFTGERRGGVSVPDQLDLCRACKKFIKTVEVPCPFCGADVKTINEAYYEKLRAARAAAFEVDLILRRMKRRQEQE